MQFIFMPQPLFLKGHVLDVRYAPSPIAIFGAGWTLTKSGELWVHFKVSMLRNLITILGIVSTFLLKELERYWVPWQANRPLAGN